MATYTLTTLQRDIKDLERNIALQKKLGNPCEFEEKLLKAWKRRLKKMQNTPRRTTINNKGH